MPTCYSIFLNESLRKQKILLRCRSIKAKDRWGTISAERFLLFGTDIYLLVTNQNIFQEGALIYGAYRCRDWYIFNMDKIYVIFAHPGWVGLNT